MQRTKKWYRIIRGSRLFHEIFLILIALMVVLTLIVAMFLSGVLTKNYSENLHRAQLSRLNQLSDSINLTFSLLEKSISQFLWSNEVIAVSVNPTRVDGSRDKKILNLLRNEKGGNELVENAYLYIAYDETLYGSNNNIVAAGNSEISSVLERYLSMDLSKREVSSSDTRWSVVYIEDRLYIFVDLYLNRRYSTAIYQINLKNFRYLIEKNGDQDKQIEIFDDQNQKVFSALYPYQCDSAELDKDMLFLQSAEAERNTSQKYYLVQDPELGWSYVGTISTKSDLVTMKDVIPVLLPLMFGILAASVLCTLYLSTKIYRPVGDLVFSIEEIQKQAETSGTVSPPQKSERDYLQALFHQALSDYGQIRDLAEQYSNSLLEHTLQGAICGKNIESADLAIMEEITGWPAMGTERYQLVIGKISGPENNLYIVNVCSWVKQVPSAQCRAIPMYWEKDQIIIVIWASADVPEEEMREYVQEIQDSVNQHIKELPCEILWGSGRIYNQINDLHTSYQEAREQLSYRQYFGEEGAAMSADQNGSKEERIQINERVRQLWAEGLDRDRQACEELLHSLLKEVYDNDNDIDWKRAAYKSILDTMNEKLISMHVRKEEIRGIRDDLEDLDSNTDFESLYACAEHTSEKALRLLYFYGRKAKYTYVDEAKAYIATHYFENSLTQNDVSEHIGITASYLSEQFRKVTGQPFLAYLNLYRVDKAKQLLATTSIPIQKVGYLCGFNSSQSFIRVFKKYTSITPGQYRSK